MNKLTEKDDQGNWCLKGLPWMNLCEGAVLTAHTQGLLYGALWKLMEYEYTEMDPEEVVSLNDFVKSGIADMIRKLQEEQEKHKWIPCSERLPVIEPTENYKNGIVTDCGEKFIVTDIYGCVYSSYFFLKGNRFDNSVVAWQPLPEPYKGK